MECEKIFDRRPDHWELTTLGEAVARGGGDVQTGPFGTQLHASDYVDAGIPSVMPKNIGDNRFQTDGIAKITHEDAVRLSRYLLQAGDIVYSRRGDVEKRALVGKNQDGWLCGTGCLRVRPGNGYVDPYYATYYLGHPAIRAWIVRHAVGATMPNLNTGILASVPFVLPPLSEQQAIASILSALDDKIELNRRMNETLEAMSRALFKSWFVDFDPVHAKAEGRNPAHMDAETAVLFPNILNDQGLPVGWSEGTSFNIADLIGGGTPRTSVDDYWNGSIPWASAKDVSQCSEPFLIHTDRSISEAGLANSSTKIIPAKSTVVVARGATTGRFCMFGDDIAMNQTCYALRATDGNHYFLRCWLSNLISKLVHAAHGSVFDTITTKTFETTTSTIPPAQLRQAFERNVTAMFDRVLNNIEESRTLAELRDTLLPKLMSGEIRVRALEMNTEHIVGRCI